MEAVNFGICGTGGAWAFHSSAFKNNPKMVLKSVYDVNLKKARRTARRYNATAYESYGRLLESDIDAVLLMIPHFLHEEYVIKAAKAGKHILCEKPMARTIEECENMIQATKKAGVKFMIAENHRFLPAHKYIAEKVQQGVIGDVFLVRAYEGVNEIPGLMTPGLWKGHPIKAGGGALMDMGVHKFATIQWILNDVPESIYTWITKQCTNLEEKAEDNAMSFLKFTNGTLAEVSVSFTVVSPPTNSIEIYGTKGTIIENHMWDRPIKIYSTDDSLGNLKGKWFEPEIEHGAFPKYYEISAGIEDNHFVDCILNDKKVEFKPEEAKQAVMTVLMAYLSAIYERSVSYQDFVTFYKKSGTEIILNKLLGAVKNNCS